MNRTPAVLLAGMLAVVIFGASPVAAKIALTGVAPLDLALLRTVLGGIIVFPMVCYLKLKLPPQRSQQLLLLLSGFCGFVAFPIIFTFGVRLSSANHSAMILAMLPVFTGAIAMLWDKAPPKRTWCAGCLTAVIGEILLISEFTGPSDNSQLSGDLLVLLSNVFAALGYVAGGKLKQSGYSSKATTFWGVCIFSIVLLPLTALVVDVPNLLNAGLLPWLGILFLAVGVTVIGYMLWYWALASGGIARVGILQFFQPISGVILAALILSESLSPNFMIASAIIMLGVIGAIKAG